MTPQVRQPTKAEWGPGLGMPDRRDLAAAREDQSRVFKCVAEGCHTEDTATSGNLSVIANRVVCRECCDAPPATFAQLVAADLAQKEEEQVVVVAVS